MAPTTTDADRSSAVDDVLDVDDDELVPLRRPRAARKYKSLKVIMRKAERVELLVLDDDGDGDCVDYDDGDSGKMTERDGGGGGDEVGGDDQYSQLGCEECGSGDKADEILICDKCDRGFHMKCLRPVVVRVPPGIWSCPNCSDHLPPRPELKKTRKRRKRSGSLVFHKKRRRLLPYVPVEDASRRLMQMASLASALIAMNIEFSSELTYMAGMAPRSANKAKFENGGMQVLSKEDFETLKCCNAMGKGGLYPPLMVVYDSYEGYTVEADGPIKDMTLIAEYAGDVDYMKKREHDDCDSLMTLLSAKNPSKSLVICPDKRGNIARFINGINNHLPESKKKQNLKCVRYDVNGECRVLLVATRDIASGERLYYDYNGHEYEYPTHHFV